MSAEHITDGSEARDAGWYNRQYDPRRPDQPMPQIIAEWQARADAWAVEPELLQYGSGERETIDLYRPENPRGLLIFYHGGYWRSCSKTEHGWIAKAFVEAGYSVAVANYPLCPDARFEEIVAAARNAFVHLHGATLPAERHNIIVAGHSAGGYLAALHRATDWVQHGLPSRPLAAAVALSGLFDLRPLQHTVMNEWLRFTPSTADQFSLDDKPSRSDVRLLALVGGDESDEFHRQSQMMASAWPLTHYEALPGRHHFDVLDELATGGIAYEHILALFRGDVDD